MNFRSFDRKIAREERRKRRKAFRKRVGERAARLLGIVAGQMLGTSWIGYVLGAAILLAALVLIGKVLL